MIDPLLDFLIGRLDMRDWQAACALLATHDVQVQMDAWAKARHLDKARLDWLDEHKISVECTVDGHKGEFFTWSDSYKKPLYSKTVRGAIDRDMKQAEKKRRG